MNRPAVGPQSLRGVPSGFANPQQISQNRSASNRIPPSGKMANNGGSWAFGGGNVPLSGALNNARSGGVPMSSFAQTIGGQSQSSAQLDLSEFPSLSNNQPQPSQSAWTASGNRNVGPSGNMRSQQSSLSSQQQVQQQHDEPFGQQSQLQGGGMGFRFGNQSAIGQSGQTNQNRSNGLLNALSGSNRPAPTNRVASPSSISGVSARSPVESGRQALGGASESDQNSFPGAQFGSLGQRDESNLLLGTTRAEVPNQQNDNNTGRPALPAHSTQEDTAPEIHDPLGHMQDLDKWGIKGFTTLMTNFSDYASLVTGTDISTLGFDLNSADPYSNQIYSLFDNEPARPPVPNFTLPECYRVLNIAQLDTKTGNFNDEALMFMFYSNPGGLQQIMAASELHSRNWRYHKKLQLWLTKDDLMVPQQLNNNSERGYYIFFDVKQWSRERRELTLVYDDLEQTQPSTRGS